MQVFLTTVGGAGELQNFEREVMESFGEFRCIEGSVDGVTRSGVGEGEIEEFASGEAPPGATDGDAGGGEGFEIRPGVGGGTGGVSELV